MEFPVLDVDLTRGRIDSLDAFDLIPDFIGAKGIGARILYDEVKPGADPLSPENILIFMAGPLSGTPAPMSGRMSAVSISPLTGTICDSHCGGYFAYEMKKAGLGGIIVRGHSDEPVYIEIRDDNVEIKVAGGVWGKDTKATEKSLKTSKKTRILSIGPAGENLVRFANIIHDGHRAFGRGGLGAVMGSKNLKAISVEGTGRVQVHDRDALKRISKECYTLINKHPTTGRVLKRYGTPNVVNVVNELSKMPSRYFTANRLDDVEPVAGETIEKHIVGQYGCFGCPVRCGKTVEVEGVRTHSLEYETIYTFGPLCGNSDLKTILEANNLCNSWGMDTISCGSAVALLFYLSNTGKVDEELAWGDPGTIIETLEMIGKREGMGDILAEGTKRAGERLDPGAAVHVKGMDFPGYDPRGVFGVDLAYKTSNRGACHLRGPIYIEEILTSALDMTTREGKAQSVINLQNLHASIDSLELCKFTARSLTEDHYARLLSAATGIDFSGEDVLRAGERIFNLERIFNVREGFTRADDRLSERIRWEDTDDVLDEYYTLRGWDNEGVPTEEKRNELGL